MKHKLNVKEDVFVESLLKLEGIGIEFKIVICVLLVIVFLLSLIILVIKNTKIKNNFNNQGIINGDVDNSVTVINETKINTFISTGEPKNNNNKEKSKISKVADSILDIPEKFINWVSNDLGSAVGGE